MGFETYAREQELVLRAAETAVLVVDMLNDFVLPEGAMYLPEGHEVVEPIARLLEDSRAIGARVVHLQEGHWPDDLNFRKRVPACLFGSPGREIIAELMPESGDCVITKRRYSGFFGTDLDLRLREWGVKTVVVTGITTNICVRSTVQDAFFLGYDVVVPWDCVRAPSDRDQEATLDDIRTHFGEVLSSSEVRSILARSSEREVAGHGLQ
jgi:ureidoacrylate peracid hydrolase